MNAQKYSNLVDFLAEFAAGLRIQQDEEDIHAFQVEIHEEGLCDTDLRLLR